MSTCLLSVLVDDPAIPEVARAILARMARHVAELDLKIDALDQQQIDECLVTTMAGAAAAQGRGDRSGQQGRPDYPGDDGAW